MSGDQETRRLLEEGVESMRAVTDSTDVGKDVGRSAFQSFQKGINRAKQHLEAQLAFVDVPEERKVVLSFVAHFAAQVRIHRNQASSVLVSLLSIPTWKEAAKNDAKLLEELRGVDPKVSKALEEPDAAPPRVTGTAQTAAPAAPAAVEVPAVVVATQPPSVQQGAAPGIASVPPDANHRSVFASELRLPPLESQEDSQAESPTEVANAAAEAETRRMLRASFQALIALDFQAEGQYLDRAMDAFHSLKPAVNRAHWELGRRRRGVRGDTSPNVDRQQSGILAFAEEEDYLGEVLKGKSWDPVRLLMMLFTLTKSRAIYERQIKQVAQMLTQMSGLVADAARSNQFLEAWLGVCRADNQKADTVSYGLASSLKWATWDASWYMASQRGQLSASKGETHLMRWKGYERDLQQSVEFSTCPRCPALLLQAMWAAAQHVMATRFPKERPGIVRGLVNALLRPEDVGPHKDEFEQCCTELIDLGFFTESLMQDLKWLIWNLAWYCADALKGYGQASRGALVRAERHFQRAFRGEKQWRGVNLGGWFLLEPGPCTTFWTSLPCSIRAEKCEWGCCEALDKEAARRFLQEHRRTYFTKDDFVKMKSYGLTHVRLPFGAWCVRGPGEGEPYVGPCLEDLDRALDQLEAVGLRVVLDLHGCVGGENNGAPCGHINEDWRPSDWDTGASLEVLSVVAKRYAGRVCVCGLGVANEPFERLPAERLAEYYEKAILTIRQAGMRAGEVAVLLPIFTEYRAHEFLKLWEKNYAKYEDCVFDLHLYQCFGMTWEVKLEEEHLHQAQLRTELLRSLPACCVSEWSLALPDRVTDNYSEESCKDLYRRFAKVQLEAFENATHGWFFWTWRDSAGTAWNMQECLDSGILKVPEGGRRTDTKEP